ncbi:MAG: branched chain amino acid aminotransferase, partial [Spirochaetales bacterium]|nr:branched chain amino acid aminotransferase [Spirochaetales bacterium]
MASAFNLAIYPTVCIAQYGDEERWRLTVSEKPHKTPAEEAALPAAEREALLARRNSFPELPLVNYTSQYALGCFEGAKAYPQ